jgi:hypothetical protein
MSRFQRAFGALVLGQCAHSAEEYLGRLWESFPPARLVSSVVSTDLERGFLLANLALVAFGLWCWLWPVRRGWPAAVPLAWAWVTLEVVNGIGHSLWALRQGGYTPGVATAPVLLILATYLAHQLRQTRIRMDRALYISVWVTMLVGCSDSQVICAPLPPWAVAVDVRDSVTDAPLVTEARGAVFLAGALEDSLRRDRILHLSSDSLLVGGMTEGLVEVRVERAGYLAWSAANVQTRLSGGDCPHWETQQLVARLQTAPPGLGR